MPCTLLLADLAQLAIVKQHMDDVHAVVHRSRELGHVLAEATIAADRDNLQSLVLDLRPGCRPSTHRRGKAEADGP